MGNVPLPIGTQEVSNLQAQQVLMELWDYFTQVVAHSVNSQVYANEGHQRIKR